ncbi:MAG: flagellar basal body rod protein FlgC [Christensenellales bacterium]|jgi:flagellar basal-body rod protein FlgC
MSITQSAIGISMSGLAAQRARMEVIAQNIANADTIRTDESEPYRRRTVALSPGDVLTFEQYLEDAHTAGVTVSDIGSDESPFRVVYDPGNPYADEYGFVTMSNVDTTREILDLIAATRSYEANLTALNATKSLLTKTLEIGL